MVFIKVSLVFLLTVAVYAEKKIKLEDIEDDNLKSEKQNDEESIQPRFQGPTPAPIPLEVLKSGLFRYYHNPNAVQQPKYIQQYDVTEPPGEEPNQHYNFLNTQEAVVGYQSNVPMQIYLVPQYYNEVQEPTGNQHVTAHYSKQAHVAGYQTPEAVQTQTNYVEVPNFVTNPGKTVVQQQQSKQIAYFTYNEPDIHVERPTAAPISYQAPVIHYTASVAQHGPTKEYIHNYQNEQYTNTNDIDEVQETVEHTPHHYPTHTEIIYQKTPTPVFTRVHSSPAPVRNNYHHNQIEQVPHAGQLVYKAPLQHTPHIPKALPLHRPPSKVYASRNHFLPQPFSQRPPEPYGPPFKRRPTSLLDSYIPSSVQIEYLKRGLAKEPMEAYEALSSGRHLHSSPVVPRNFERGFLPNQMYHTAAGGITFGHYKRSPNFDKSRHQ